MLYLPINVQKSNTDSTDATDLIFSRILYCLLDLNRISLRLSARDFSLLLCGLKAEYLIALGYEIYALSIG